MTLKWLKCIISPKVYTPGTTYPVTVIKANASHLAYMQCLDASPHRRTQTISKSSPHSTLLTASSPRVLQSRGPALCQISGAWEEVALCACKAPVGNLRRGSERFINAGGVNTWLPAEDEKAGSSEAELGG